MRLLLFSLILLGSMHMLQAAETAYLIELKDGKQLTGYITQLTNDRIKVDILFKGKVMGSRTINGADVLAKTVVEIDIPKKETKVKEKTAETDERSETAKTSKTTRAKKDLEAAFKKAHIACNAAKQGLDLAAGNLKVQSENVALTKSIDKDISAAEKALKIYIEALQEIGDIRSQQYATISTASASLSEKQVAFEIEAVQTKLAADILSAQAAKEKIRLAHKWIKSANLKAVPESLAKGDDKELKRIQRLNKKLAQLRGIKDTPTAYKAVLVFMDNTDQFPLYITTH